MRIQNKAFIKIVNYLAFPVKINQEIKSVILGKKIEFILKTPISIGCGEGLRYFIILDYKVYFKRTFNLLKHKLNGDYKGLKR